MAQVEVADASEAFLLQLFGGLVVDNLDMDFLRFLSYVMRIDLTHVTIADHTIVGDAQETHGMGLVAGDRLSLLKVVGRSLVHVETTSVALAEEHHFLIAGKVTWVTILAHVGRHNGMSLFLGVIINHIARH